MKGFLVTAKKNDQHFKHEIFFTLLFYGSFFTFLDLYPDSMSGSTNSRNPDPVEFGSNNYPDPKNCLFSSVKCTAYLHPVTGTGFSGAIEIMLFEQCCGSLTFWYRNQYL